jgi:gliding motility-associated-like protein
MKKEEAFNKFPSFTIVLPIFTALLFKSVPVFVFCLLAVTNLLAQSPPCAVNTFHKVYGKANLNDLSQDIVETPDGGFITGGWGADNGDCFLMKIDSKGDIVWLRQIADPGPIRGYMKRFIRLKDGNYIGLGRGYRPDYLDTWIIKFDEDGNIIWNKEITYPTGIGNDAYGIVETTDGGLAICASYSPFANAGGSLIVKLSANGNMLWNRAHLGDYSVAGITEKNGILYMAGRTNDRDGIILKMKASDGSYIDGRLVIIDSKRTTFWGIQEKGGKLYVNGYNTDNQSFDGLKQVITILDTALNVLKMHKFNLDFREEWEIPAMAVTDDGGYIASEVDDHNPDILLFRVSYDGVIQWKRRYTRTGDQRIFNIKTTIDKGFIGVGTSSSISYYHNANDNYIFKTDSLGLSAGCPADDINATIFTPQYNSWSTFFNYQSLSLPMIDIVSINRPVSVPVASLCQNVTLPVCHSLNISGSDKVCGLSNTVIYKAARSSGCTVPVQWRIDPAMATILSTTDSTIQLRWVNHGQTTLTATIPDPCQPVTASLVVTIAKGAEELNLGDDRSLCPGNSFTLNAGKGYSAYHWQDGSTDSIINVRAPGTYHVLVTTACGDFYTDTVSVTAAPPIPFNVGPDRTKCNNDTVQITAPHGFLNYTWSNNYNISATSTQAVIVNPLVDTLYYVKAEKSPGCFAYDTVRVQVHQSPRITLGPDRSICSGDSILMDAGSGFQHYQWSNGLFKQQQFVKEKGEYQVLAITAEGCQSRDTVTVTNVHALPVVTLDKDPGICRGATKTLQAGNFISYQWSTGADTPAITVNDLGSYSVTVTDFNGCKGSDTAHITTVRPLPTGFLPADTTMCSYGTLELKSLESFSRYQWSTGESKSAIRIESPNTYWLQVTDRFGCIGADSITVGLKQCMTGFYIPTAFTPNGDGKNDLFQPLLLGRIKKFGFTVYNRWGQVIFQTTEQHKGWDGKVAGLDQRSDVFVWTCTYQLEGEEVKQQKGTVTIVR